MVTRNQIMKIAGVREIDAHLRSVGWSIRFLNHRYDYFANGLCQYDPETDKGALLVYLIKPDGSPVSMGSILFVLAHEYRHFLHQQLGLYKKYYDRDELDAGKAYAGHLLLVGLAAERDCDRYATSWLKKNAPGLSSGFVRRDYPIWKIGREVLPWRLRQEQAARIGLASALHGGKTSRTVAQWRKKIKNPGDFDDLDLQQLLINIENARKKTDSWAANLKKKIIDDPVNFVVSFEDEEFLTLDVVRDGEAPESHP